ncbi:MAG: heme-binding protein [Acidimicrobiales bacterium]
MTQRKNKDWEGGRNGQRGQPLFGLQNTHNGRIVIFGGGVLLQVNGQLIGAVGASGGTVGGDVVVAEAAAAAPVVL